MYPPILELRTKLRWVVVSLRPQISHQSLGPGAEVIELRRLQQPAAVSVRVRGEQYETEFQD
jgi:hypothetical protein